MPLAIFDGSTASQDNRWSSREESVDPSIQSRPRFDARSQNQYLDGWPDLCCKGGNKQIMTTSPLWNRDPISGRNTVAEQELCGKINIRGRTENRRFLTTLEKAIGLSLPLKPNTLSRSDDATCFWLGPDEWLLHCPLQKTNPLIESTRLKLAKQHHALVDVSDYYTVLRLEGPDSETLLAKACPLDLHRRQFPAETCAQTRFGNAGILLDRRGKSPCFDIQVRWSYAEYVWDYLVSAMKTL